MRLESYLCLAGQEISNGYRVATYAGSYIAGLTMGTECQCAQLDEGFSDPLSDPAPWYEASRPESGDFYGFWASGMTLPPVASRQVSANGRRGSALAPLSFSGRTVEVAGLLLAGSAEGMSYGERWLSEVLRGSPCSDGDCPSDDVVLLPACPQYETYDADRYFRTLVNVGMVDGPVFGNVQQLPECKIQQAGFTLASTQPWLYHPATRCLDAEVLDDATILSCPLTTPEWMGEGTFRIELFNATGADATDITIQGQISLDGGCPVTDAGSSVPPSWSYTIATLKPEDRLVIDGARRQVRLFDASCKQWSNGLSSLTFERTFKWPDVGACTTMCLTLTAGGGEVATTVDAYLREL